MGTQICHKWKWEEYTTLFHVCQNSQRSTRRKCNPIKCCNVTSFFLHFECSHFDYSTITDNMRFWVAIFEAKAVECLLFNIYRRLIITVTKVVHYCWLFSDKGRSLVRREWQWEGMGINSGNGTGMGIKCEASWEWNWEWTEGNVTEWECCKQFPRISSVYT